MKVKTISIICVCYFTKSGEEIFKRLKASMPDYVWNVYEKRESISSWTKDAFSKALPIVFIGATGIAVRSIAPFVNDKLKDSPVFVIDEKGRFVIPLLCGHFGSANILAQEFSKNLSSTAVITTATDINNAFSVDVFAKKNALQIINKESIKVLSSKILEGKDVLIWVEKGISYNKDFSIKGGRLIESNLCPKDADLAISIKPLAKMFLEPFKNQPAILNLVPKNYCLGIGLRKGKSLFELEQAIKGFLQEVEELKTEGINSIEQLGALASIDLKENERGLLELSHKYHLPVYFYTSNELKSIKGDFSESTFVQKITGVSNVCERAAFKWAMESASLVVKKTIKEGITLALCKRNPKIESWED